MRQHRYASPQLALNKKTTIRTIALDDDVLCWDASNQRVFLANKTGAQIVQWHSQGWTQADMVKALSSQYGLTEQQVSADVASQLHALASNSLPIQDSEFGLNNAGQRSAEHQCAGGTRYRLSQNGDSENDNKWPDVVVHTDITGLVEQLVRVFALPLLNSVDSGARGIQTLASGDDGAADSSKDIVAGQCGKGYFIAVGASLIAQCDNLSALLHHCVGHINTRWTVSQPHDVVIHAAGVSLDDNVVLIPAASGSGKSTLATWLAMQGYTFWGDDLIALAHRCDTILPSTLCASVKSPSRSVVFESAESMAAHHTVLRLQEDASARDGGWNSQSIMLDQIRAPLSKHSARPNCILFSHYDPQCKTLEARSIDSADAFKRIAAAGLATNLTASPDGLVALCRLLERCNKVHVRYRDCEEVRNYLCSVGTSLVYPEVKSE